MGTEEIWSRFRLGELEQGIEQLFPKDTVSLKELFSMLLAGDPLGALMGILNKCLVGIPSWMQSSKELLVWLLVLGLVSALLTYFVQIYDCRQVADLSFFFCYLLFVTILVRTYYVSAGIVQEAIENILLFIKLLIPTYVLAVGVSAGTASAGVVSQLMLLVVLLIEKLLAACLLPAVNCFLLLSVINTVWKEEAFSYLLELLKKSISFLLKLCVWAVTGISFFQALITPLLGAARTSVLTKVLSNVPIIGKVSGGVAELALGSALLIKNSVGAVLLLLMLYLCAAPIVKIGAVAGTLKVAAALIQIVNDKRLGKSVDQTADAGFLLLRVLAVAMLLFLIALAVLTATIKPVV